MVLAKPWINRIGANLVDYLIANGAAKEQGCTRHKEPVRTQEDVDSNCAIEGYLMYLPLEERPEASRPVPSDADLDVEVRTSSGTSTVNLKRTRKYKKDRLADFERTEGAWVKNTFDLVCRRWDGTSVLWGDYGDALLRMAEFYHLDPEKRGHLFVATFMDQRRKQLAHLPFTGVMSSPYLFVALVCAVSGFGKGLMNLAKETAYRLGCKGIALASLSNSAGFYYSLGFRFVSKWSGQLIDTTKFTTQAVRGGATKTILLTDAPDDLGDPDDPDNPGEPYWKLYRKKRKYLHKQDCDEEGSRCVISMGP